MLVFTGWAMYNVNNCEENFLMLYKLHKLYLVHISTEVNGYISCGEKEGYDCLRI
jgi:hypothetical protein